ncbi:peptidoglycan DD-metalloendopeptidase family protein [Paenibacillus sp. IB182496]|uniref:Peptidoglycan DD-metalloendopeptidase family protein n=1 Tax=Paenibacillus sabuli TaxID=2772509 RepID=A0A927BQC1_9BACL|nr:M23 family metallopeptidase [Paenibacillus sabuli]MBD2844766.1 peptidoglycan DD-metalloendopeptidase family protein [Paenibacillus sabuli]
MNRRALALVTVLLLVCVVFRPISGQAASTVEEIDQQISRVKNEMRSALNEKASAEAEMETIQQEREATQESLNLVMDQINEVAVNMQNVSIKIADTELALQEAGRNLEDTEARIEQRDELLQSRVRLLYTSGFVSYMDVLLSSTSFADFLTRTDALQAILHQDKDILAEHKRDKELQIVQQQEIEDKMAEVTALYGRLEAYSMQLMEKEKQKEVMILNYDKRTEELEHVSEEQEALVMQLARKNADLEKEKVRVQSVYSGGKMLLPIGQGYRISSSFGPRTHPITGVKGKMHTGTDFAAPQGTPIYAAEAGTVIVAQVTSGYGNTVIIDHGNGIWTLYAHIRNGGIKVESGEQVKRGQKIAEVGTTGNSTGPHLHFEVRENEKPVDPMGYLR